MQLIKDQFIFHGKNESALEFVRMPLRSLKIAPQSIALAREPLNGNINQYCDEQKRQSKIHGSPKTSQPSRSWFAQFVPHHHLGTALF